MCVCVCVCYCLVLSDGGGADYSQLKEGVAKVTSKISTVASSVIETFQVLCVCVCVCVCCLLYTSPSPRDATLSRMPSSA